MDLRILKDLSQRAQRAQRQELQDHNARRERGRAERCLGQERGNPEPLAWEVRRRWKRREGGVREPPKNL